MDNGYKITLSGFNSNGNKNIVIEITATTRMYCWNFLKQEYSEKKERMSIMCYVFNQTKRDPLNEEHRRVYNFFLPTNKI